MNEHKAIFSNGIFSLSRLQSRTRTKLSQIMVITTIIASIVSSPVAQALDFPVFYRAPLFQGTPKIDRENWTTYFTVGYDFGSGKKAWDSHGNKVDLLNVYGLVNAAHLGLNVQDQQAKNPDGSFVTPVTAAFWQDAQVIIDDTKVPPLVTAEKPPSGLLGNFYKDPTNKIAISLSGELTVQQVDFTLHQNLMAGFYAHVYLPIRQIEVSTIARKIPCTVTGAGEIAALTSTAEIPSTPDAPNPLHASGLLVVQPNNDNMNPPPNMATTDPVNALSNIDLVLKEHCLTGLKEPFKKTGCSDALVSLGWQVFDDSSFGTFVKTVEAAVQLGILLPVAASRDENHLYSIPLGYNRHYGANARAYVQIGITDVFAIGAQTGVMTFIKSNRNMRMKTDIHQSGIIVLDKGRADVDQGSIWDLGLYGTARNFCKGLEAIVGYSFTRNEPTVLGLEDHKFLKAVYERELSRNPPRIFPRCEVINSDERNKGWEQHVIHAVVKYDFKKHKDLWFSPCLKISGSVPIAGKRVFIVNMFGASFGVTLNWDF